MNKQKIEAAISILTDILEGKSTPSIGICEAMRGLEIKYRFPDYYKSWEYFSGNYHFPVPSTNYISSFWLCVTFNDFWGVDHEYGRLRRHLAQHIINCLKQELEEFTQ